MESQVEFTREWPNDRKNSSPFFENLQNVRRKFCVPDTIVVGLGPGSYAGIRIAISAAIGLQLCCEADLIGYPSICAMESDAEEYCVVGDARRESFFFGRVVRNELVEGPVLCSGSILKAKLESLGATIAVFSSELLPQFGRVITDYPAALVLARLAQESRLSFSSPPLEPIYLREPHITISR